ncbi:hypothetical protein PDESU_02634 [Pontiella desulfatans]|uniref:LamG-like jellyroll fold domain-containing protein n=2 Tax=Pontiella desulfatans TaxID=2750659 RepID=A0A6C2U2I0_PONDE|nr:hypothetical protein PDESU_02634 [Pontiella desulfatans]
MNIYMLNNLKNTVCCLVISLATGVAAQSDWWSGYDGTCADTIAYYSFDESTVYANGASLYSAVVPDQPDKTWDAFYSTNTATCFFGPGGRQGFGLHVPGGSDIASKCSTRNGSNIFPAATDPSLTVECRVLFNSVAGIQFLVSKGNAWSSKGGYDLWYDNNALKCAFGDSDTNKMITTVSWLPSTGVWHHVASTWNAGDDTARLYVDGEELVSKVFSGKSIIDHTGRTLALGQRSVSLYTGLNGIIDDVRISGVAYEFSRPEKPARATYPWGDKFWFSFYSTIGDDSQYAVEHGSSGIGPYYGGIAGQAGPLAEADVLGASFSYKVQLPSMIGFSAQATNFVWPSDETLIAETKAVVSAVMHNPNISMWDLVPEELRYWRSNEMNFIEIVSEVIRQTDPYGRPVMMYEPNHRNATALAVTVPYQDICASGTYISTTSPFRHNRIWARWSMEQELGAIAAANTNAVPWIMLWMAVDAMDGEEHWINDWCRHDAYMGLIMGGKGISIWSGWRPRSSWTNDFQAYFDGYLSVAADLNLDKNFAPVFMDGTEATGVTYSITAGPAELELVYPAGVTNTYPPVTYTLREYLGQQYLFAVNSATQAVTVTFSGVPDAMRTDLFQGLENSTPGGSFSKTFAPYEVTAFRFDGYETWRDSQFTQQQIDDGLGDPDADPDGDGCANRDEYIAGTEPLVFGDCFATDLSFSNDWKTVSFQTSSNRFYTVDLSTNLVEGHWVPMVGNEPGTGADFFVTDTNVFPNAFYRTRVNRP